MGPLKCTYLCTLGHTVCRNYPCKGSLTKRKADIKDLVDDSKTHNAYSHFSDSVKVKENNVLIKTGEPDFVNPNSYNNICQIIRNLGVRAGIGRYQTGKRQWLFLEADGTICCIVEQLILNVLSCTICKNSFYGEEAFNEHPCHSLTDVRAEHEFDWLVLMPGLLHIEMNSAKTFSELNWTIFVCDVLKLPGFKSEKALLFAKKSSDHHKTWDSLQITYVAIADELLVLT